LNIVIDIGNSRVKLGYFEGDRLLAATAHPHAEFPQAVLASEAWQRYSPQSKYLGWVSVGRETMVAATHTLIASQPHLQVLGIDRATALPICNRYRSPETLGMDRICAAVAAHARALGQPVLVVNAGTAITYEYVNAAGDYCGGGISLGLRSRFRALHEFTAALPLIDQHGPLQLVGDDTATCMRSGVVNGLLAEIEGIIASYRDLAGPTLQVFLTGGDADFLGNHLKSVTFVDANLLLYGINSIISYHAQ
jgi:type III pantothenate kinase